MNFVSILTFKSYETAWNFLIVSVYFMYGVLSNIRLIESQLISIYPHSVLSTLPVIVRPVVSCTLMDEVMPRKARRKRPMDLPLRFLLLSLSLLLPLPALPLCLSYFLLCSSPFSLSQFSRGCFINFPQRWKAIGHPSAWELLKQQTHRHALHPHRHAHTHAHTRTHTNM